MATAQSTVAEFPSELIDTIKADAVEDAHDVAVLLDVLGFPVGPYSRRKTWDGKMVRRVFCNPVLKGMPMRGKLHTIKHYETGARKSVKNAFDFHAENFLEVFFVANEAIDIRHQHSRLRQHLLLSVRIVFNVIRNNRFYSQLFVASAL